MAELVNGPELGDLEKYEQKSMQLFYGNFFLADTWDAGKNDTTINDAFKAFLGRDFQFPKRVVTLMQLAENRESQKEVVFNPVTNKYELYLRSYLLLNRELPSFFANSLVQEIKQRPELERPGSDYGYAEWKELGLEANGRLDPKKDCVMNMRFLMSMGIKFKIAYNFDRCSMLLMVEQEKLLFLNKIENEADNFDFQEVASNPQEGDALYELAQEARKRILAVGGDLLG